MDSANKLDDVRCRPAAAEDRKPPGARERILDAFANLMLEVGYEAMTVQHILDYANVGRATFYAHFNSKEDLLRLSIGRLGAGLAAAHREAGGGQFLGFTLFFFRHVDSHRHIYDTLIGRASFHVVGHHMRRMLAERVREETQQVGPPLSEAVQTLVEQHVVGALWSVVSWWMERKSGLEAEEVNALFLQLALPGLEALLRKA